MKKLNTMWAGMAGGLITPIAAFVIYSRIKDPHLHLADSVSRLIESGVLAYYASLCAIANLAVFFLCLRFNADRAARGVLGATIIYAFTILFIRLA